MSTYVVHLRKLMLLLLACSVLFRKEFHTNTVLLFIHLLYYCNMKIPTPSRRNLTKSIYDTVCPITSCIFSQTVGCSEAVCVAFLEQRCKRWQLPEIITTWVYLRPDLIFSVIFVSLGFSNHWNLVSLCHWPYIYFIKMKHDINNNLDKFQIHFLKHKLKYKQQIKTKFGRAFVGRTVDTVGLHPWESLAEIWKLAAVCGAGAGRRRQPPQVAGGRGNKPRSLHMRLEGWQPVQ